MQLIQDFIIRLLWNNSNLEKLSELSKTQDIITMINDDDTYRDKTTFSFSENFRKEFT